VVFSSPSFIFLFLPLFFASYCLIPPQARNTVILLGSLFFYFTGAGRVAVVLILSVPLNHYVGKYMFRHLGTRAATMALVLGIVANLLPLLIYKYLGFFGGSVNDALFLFGAGRTFTVPEILLPAGISFFTFQGLSYLVDIYWRKIDPAPTMIDFGMYHTSFPQLIAGPIVRYIEIKDRVLHRPLRLTDVEWGIIRFCIGLAKKIVIADNMGVIADRVFTLPPSQLTASLAWLGTIAYTLQIYFDFSGYSDMAIGLGRMLGFRFPENFNQPYRSQSVSEFWRRWHMTLSRWFRDYLYIPLGGSRCGPVRTYFNLFIVFFLCGLWHGAAYTFIVWGLFHGSLLVIERLMHKHGGFEPSGLVGWAVTFILVMIGWVLFRSESVGAALAHLAAMFGNGRATEDIYSVAFYLTPDKMVFLSVGVLISLFPLERVRWLVDILAARGKIWAKAGALACFVYSLSCIAANGFNPFIYFRF